ncbi:MAG: anti-sigma factor [Chloroflexi bacterium]|nr:anti-sigma factor [Chloroflexota bacterium]
MDCNKAEEQFLPYILGSLESAEMETLQAHVESCGACRRQMQDEGETLSRLAFAVPRLEAPAHLKDRLLARIELVDGPATQRNRPSRRAFFDKNLFSLPTAGAVASLLLIGVIFGGVWLNGRLNEVSDGNRENAGQLAQVAKSNEDLNDKIPKLVDIESGVIDVLGEQQRRSYVAPTTSSPAGTSVNMLWGTGWEANARGMLMVSRSGKHALLLALDLRPLPPDMVYQVWLVKDGRRYNGGYFTVDSSGYGQTLIFPYASIAEFEGIGITIEPIGGSSGPTGISVLKGDL